MLGSILGSPYFGKLPPSKGLMDKPYGMGLRRFYGKDVQRGCIYEL